MNENAQKKKMIIPSFIIISLNNIYILLYASNFFLQLKFLFFFAHLSTH